LKGIREDEQKGNERKSKKEREQIDFLDMNIKQHFFRIILIFIGNKKGKQQICLNL